MDISYIDHQDIGKMSNCIIRKNINSLTNNNLIKYLNYCGKKYVQTKSKEWGNRYRDICSFIIQKNIGLVKKNMVRHLGFWDQDELFSAGLQALHKSVIKFNPWRGPKFSSYSYKVISRAITKRLKKIQDVNKTLELNENLYHNKIKSDQTNDLKERLADIILSNKANLSTRERVVINHRFLTNNYEYLTLKETGKIFGFSEQRAHEVQKRALVKLRNAMGDI